MWKRAIRHGPHILSRTRKTTQVLISVHYHLLRKYRLKLCILVFLFAAVVYFNVLARLRENGAWVLHLFVPGILFEAEGGLSDIFDGTP